MQTAEALQRKLHTAMDLHSLVKTMKALAAVNIRQLEHAVDALVEYHRTVELGMQALLTQKSYVTATARRAPQSRLGAVIIGSDQGMCGQLNDQIVSFAVNKLSEDVALRSAHDEDDRQTTPWRSKRRQSFTVLAVGSRVASRLEDAGQMVDVVCTVPSSTAGIYPLVQDLVVRIEQWHTTQHINHIVLFYCEHLSRASYRPRRVELLPIDRNWLERLSIKRWPTRVLPMFTMNQDQLFSALVRHYLFVLLYRAVAESLASENASRLAAMRGAEKNIGERIEELTAEFHQQRQTSITEELIDIASGFEAQTTT